MSIVNNLSKFITLRNIVAGVIGIIIALWAMFERITGPGKLHSFLYVMLVIALALLGFGLSILIVELSIRLVKKLAPEQGFSPTSNSSRGNDAPSRPNREAQSRSEVNTPSFAYSNVRPAKVGTSSLWKPIALVALIALMAGLSPLLFKGMFALNKLKNKDEDKYVTKEEIKQTTDQLSKKATYWSITEINKSNLALVNSDGTGTEDPKAQYLVSIPDKYVGQVSIFPTTEYVMRGGNILKLDPNVRDVCGTIDKTLEDQDGILKALQDSQLRGHLSFLLWGVVNPGVELGIPKAALIELAAILRRLAGLKAKKIEILVKGYADGQTSRWTARLLSEPYNYKTVNVYLPVETNRLNSFKFIRQETPLPVNENYSNKDLPELRARFVKEEFIDRFLEECKGSAKVEVHILKGYAEDSNKINERDRKAEIYINIY